MGNYEFVCESIQRCSFPVWIERLDSVWEIKSRAETSSLHLKLCLKKKKNMATLFSPLSLHSARPSSSSFSSSSSSSSSSPFFAFCSFPLRSRISSLKAQTILLQKMKRVVKAVEEETQQELTAVDESEQPSTSEAPPVVVPVSPSDTLTMFFQVQQLLVFLFIRMNRTQVPASLQQLIHYVQPTELDPWSSITRLVCAFCNLQCPC